MTQRFNVLLVTLKHTPISDHHFLAQFYIVTPWLMSSELVKTKIFPNSFGRGRFQGNLLKF